MHLTHCSSRRAPPSTERQRWHVTESMRFIHLAPRSAIGLIRRNGLRFGGGRRGKGVYAVPLFRIRRMRAKQPGEFDATRLDFSAPLSSMTLWDDLFNRRRHRGRRPVAVVFELPVHCWPVDVFLEVRVQQAEPFFRWLRRREENGLEISDEALKFVSTCAAQGFISDLEARAHNAGALGLLLRHFLAAGATAWSRYDETIEVVIRRPVPPAAIRKLVPLSQTNAKARVRRERETRREDTVDDA